VSQRLRSLIPRLVERTSAGEIEWKSLATNFMHSMPGGGALVLSKVGTRYLLMLVNESIQEVDTEMEEDEKGELYKLWEMLNKKTLKVDETFANLEKDLGLK
jgi:hypothetical protein